MNTYTISLKTFGTHPSGNTFISFNGLTEIEANKKWNELAKEQKSLLLDWPDYTLSIDVEDDSIMDSLECVDYNNQFSDI